MQLRLTNCLLYSARHLGETAIAARAPVAIAAGPETDATVPNPQVKKQKESAPRFMTEKRYNPNKSEQSDA